MAWMPPSLTQNLVSRQVFRPQIRCQILCHLFSFLHFGHWHILDDDSSFPTAHCTFFSFSWLPIENRAPARTPGEWPAGGLMICSLKTTFPTVGSEKGRKIKGKVVEIAGLSRLDLITQSAKKKKLSFYPCNANGNGLEMNE